MALSELLVKREGAIVVVTINRPEKLNALNKEVLEEFKRLVDVLETDKAPRALVLTGSGEKSFCVGADLKERQGMNEKDVLVRLEFVRQLYLRLEKLAIPTIAAINGTCLGGGLELALICDLRIAADNVTMGLPETSLAIIPGNGGTQRLTRVVGFAKAMELVLLAKRISAAEAMTLGLVNRVVPPGQALNGALAMAGEIAEMGPIATRQAKAAIRGGLERTWEQALAWETECYKPCIYSKDRLEGLKAFAEKRKPHYHGH